MQMIDKSALRRELRRLRRAVPDRKRLELSALTAKTICSAKEYKDAEVILTYISAEYEPDTSFIINKAFSDRKIVAAPRCDVETHKMRFLRFSTWDELEAGAYGIREPKTCCGEIRSFSDSLCIVPGLAFDMSGMRLGYGGGYYDRFLSAFTGISCGYCFDEFIFDSLPTDIYDRAADMIATESGLIRIRRQDTSEKKGNIYG